MGEVSAALVPAALVHVWFFGPGLLFNMAVAVAVALASEAAMLRARGRPAWPALKDLSALVTALLLAFALPPLTPWYVTAIGSLFAIVFAKQLYGGLGYNPFNPAMAGYVVILISFPAELTRWLPAMHSGLASGYVELGPTLTYLVTGRLPDGVSWDAIGGATPLDDMKTQLSVARTLSEILAAPLYGDFGGKGWEWVSNAVGLGGLWLLFRRIIRWQIPVGVLAGLSLPATVAFLMDSSTHPSTAFHLFSGATMLAAFFIATDPVSAATSPTGRLVYGFGIGVLTFVIRAWGGYPDGVAFAVLLMNMAVPTIDRYTRPRVFGHVR
jgi:electron transport complex protein RnfD